MKKGMAIIVAGVLMLNGWLGSVKAETEEQLPVCIVDEEGNVLNEPCIQPIMPNEIIIDPPL